MCVTGNSFCFCLVSSVVVTAKTTRSALTSTAPVMAASPAGTVHDATARARLVLTVTAAGRSVHAAGITNHVTPKLGNVGGVTLDGLDPGVHF